jgi:V/A-type H+-transporting ATPase subunit B
MQPRVTVHDAAVKLDGPLLFLRRTLEVGLNEAVEVIGTDGRPRLGRVVTIDEGLITIEMLEPSAGLALADTVVRFRGAPVEFGVGPGLLGRVFNGVGQVIDGGPPVAVRSTRRVDGLPLNPVARATPRAFIETGLSAVDLMNSLVRGQKLPIFSGGGLPHDRIAVEIAGHARLRGAQASEFAIVFAGIGVPYTTAEFFRRSLEQSGALARIFHQYEVSGHVLTRVVRGERSLQTTEDRRCQSVRKTRSTSAAWVVASSRRTSAAET